MKMLKETMRKVTNGKRRKKGANREKRIRREEREIEREEDDDSPPRPGSSSNREGKKVRKPKEKNEKEGRYDGEEEEVCKLCEGVDPPIREGEDCEDGSLVGWAGCDCGAWFHLSCSSLYSVPTDFTCSSLLSLPSLSSLSLLHHVFSLARSCSVL